MGRSAYGPWALGPTLCAHRPSVGAIRMRTVSGMRTVLAVTLVGVLIAIGLGAVAAGQPEAKRPAPASAAGPAAAVAGQSAAPAAQSGGSAPATAPAAPAPAAAGSDIVKRAGDIPGPLTRTAPTTVKVDLETKEVVGTIADGTTYTYMTFNGTVPGPFLRVRVGDTVQLTLHNAADSKWPHSIDLHAVTGPGGGATVTQTDPGQTTTLTFKALNPGLYVYHCATAPVPMHVAMGMYGLILVEPEGGLPQVDREFYVVQGELYTSAATGTKGALTWNAAKATNESPDYVVFNGKPAGLTGDAALRAKVGERVRIYFGVGGFLPSSFHVIGEIFDVVYPEAGLGDPIRNVQTTLVPAGGAVAVEFTVQVPGRYLLVDHTLPRVFDKGAVGYLEVEGPEAPEIYQGTGGAAAGH